jgi:hypothetical protein
MATKKLGPEQPTNSDQRPSVEFFRDLAAALEDEQIASVVRKIIFPNGPVSLADLSGVIRRDLPQFHSDLEVSCGKGADGSARASARVMTPGVARKLTINNVLQFLFPYIFRNVARVRPADPNGTSETVDVDIVDASTGKSILTG